MNLIPVLIGQLMKHPIGLPIDCIYTGGIVESLRDVQNTCRRVRITKRDPWFVS